MALSSEPERPRVAVRSSAVIVLSFVLAFVHLFPARHHLGLLLDAPSFVDACKGVGAALAVAFLALPHAWHLRVVGAIAQRRRVLGGLALLLAGVHVIPALEHLPKIVAAGWPEAWRGVGATIAVLWFVSPQRWQARLVGHVVRPARVVRLVAAAGALAVAAVALWGGCDDQTLAAPPGSSSGDPGPGPTTNPACPPCISDADCKGGVCAQLGADSFCAPACPKGDECAKDRTCTPVSNVAGDQVSVCASLDPECAATSDAPPVDAGGPPMTCPGLAGPTTASSCTSCMGKPTCQTNGCYGGWWCNTATNRCQAPPTSCGGAGGGTFDAGGPVSGTVDANGGKLSRLLFAVVGDTRPPTPDDTTGYPTAVITKIYSGIEGLSPRPAFVLGTGDYMFASTSGSQAGPQLDLYLAARGKYSNVLLPALGNHECTGATVSNCGPGAANGTTKNYTAFLQKMLGPIGKTDPYYSVHVDASDGSWTSKIVVVAANAWNPTQASWLDAELAKPTTYTFLVRHESHSVTQAPGVKPAEQIMANHPYTLSFVGHTHTYEHFAGSREVIVGNGGAPATGGKNYGFAVAQQRPDKSIQVDVLDYATLQPDTSFRFAVKADGSAAP